MRLIIIEYFRKRGTEGGAILLHFFFMQPNEPFLPQNLPLKHRFEIIASD